MATHRLPSIIKTWQIDANNVAAIAEGAPTDNQKTLFAIKDSLINFSSNPWVVVSSSDSSTADSNDNWIDYADLVWGTGARSWIILQKPTTGSQILISLDQASSVNLSIYWSPGGLFTGGNTTTNPTATDQVTIQSLGNWHGNLSNYSSWVHVWHSSDGSKTRVVASNGSTSPRLFWILDEIDETFPSGWTNPEVVMVFEDSTGGAIRKQNMSDSPVINNAAKSYHNSSGFDVYVYSQGYSISSVGGDNWVTEQEAGAVPNELQTDGGYPISPIGILSDTTNFRGVHGVLTDLWFGHESVINGSTYPNSTFNKRLAQAGDVILPWLNTSETPLFSGGSTPETTIDGTYIGYGITIPTVTSTTIYLMVGEDSGAPSEQKPYYITWKVTDNPDPAGAQAPSPPFGGPIINIAVTSQYDSL